MLQSYSWTKYSRKKISNFSIKIVSDTNKNCNTYTFFILTFISNFIFHLWRIYLYSFFKLKNERYTGWWRDAVDRTFHVQAGGRHGRNMSPRPDHLWFWLGSVQRLSSYLPVPIIRLVTWKITSRHPVERQSALWSSGPRHCRQRTFTRTWTVSNVLDYSFVGPFFYVDFFLKICFWAGFWINIFFRD